jgi:hypothetical protein
LIEEREQMEELLTQGKTVKAMARILSQRIDQRQDSFFDFIDVEDLFDGVDEDEYDGPCPF